MTQEELDALMNGELDLDALDDAGAGDVAEESEAEDETLNEEGEDAPKERYRASATQIMPPPATDDNKMVHQLDDVTKESEEKASEIFDIIDGISNALMDNEGTVASAQEAIASNIVLFENLTERFPEIAAFRNQLETNRRASEDIDSIAALLQESGDKIMMVMDIMQYQDIHRQKIERVINIMRALTGYMNNLFEGRKDDHKRVSSATHLPGDTTTEDIVTNDDIEALLESFGR